MTRLWAWLTGTSPAAERAMREAAISAAPRSLDYLLREANRNYAKALRELAEAFRPIFAAHTRAMAQMAKRLRRAGVMP